MRKRTLRVGLQPPRSTYAAVMSKRRHSAGRVTPKGTRPHFGTTATNSQAHAGVQPFIDDIKRNLRGPSPLGLLTLASSVIQATTERPLDRMRPESSGTPKRPEVFESFVESRVPETEALAIAVAAIHTDELLARRLRDRIEIRGSVLRHPPPWLANIGDIQITDVAQMVHVLDDGDNVYISWRWPNKSAATLLVYIDHNMGTIVKDAFVLPEGFGSMMQRYETIELLEDQVIRPLDPATARARIVQAVMHGDALFPPIQNETWPAVRPMLEWILKALPEGGQGYVRPVWTTDQRQELAWEFAFSPPAKATGIPPAETMHIGELLVAFGCESGTGDPLRWSPVSVEIVLVDWYPRNVFDPPELMQRVPELVAAFVRFAHARRHIPSNLTAETVAAVGRWTPVYLEAAMRPGRSPRDTVASMIRQAAGVDPDDETWEDDEDLIDSVLAEAELDEMETQLVEDAGGPEAYAALNDDPLPDEPFDWSLVPDQWRDKTSLALARLDQMTTDLCDVETRTVARRVLANLAIRGDVFKRPTTDMDALAAGIIWALCREWQISITRLGFKFQTQQELSALTGVKRGMISSRSHVLGVDRQLGPDWTHSQYRRALLKRRQLIETTRRDIKDGY
jgi:hypothetical protein